jgi:hypothetical protein
MTIVEMADSQKVPFLLGFASGEKFSRSEKSRLARANWDGLGSAAAEIFFAPARMQRIPAISGLTRCRRRVVGQFPVYRRYGSCGEPFRVLRATV